MDEGDGRVADPSDVTDRVVPAGRPGDPDATVDPDAATEPDAATAVHEAARFEARVLRAFVRDGRLVTIPAQQRKRAVILRWLAETQFTEDEAYPERDVNMRLALVHPDVAALRRYLVEAGLMTRAAGVYRRVPRAAG